MSTDWCMEERCRHRHWRSGPMPTHRRGDDCPPESVPVTGMEHAIEKVARTLFLSDRGGTLPAGFSERQWDEGHAVKDDYIRRARALAESGLIAPAPLREEWAAEGTLDSGDDWIADCEFATRLGAEDFLNSNEWARRDGGHVSHRYYTDWLPVDRADNNGSADR